MMKISSWGLALILGIQVAAHADKGGVSGSGGEMLIIDRSAAMKSAAERREQKRPGGEVWWTCSKFVRSGTQCDQEVTQKMSELHCDIAYHTEDTFDERKRVPGPDCTPYGVGSYPSSGFSCHFHSNQCRDPVLFDPCAPFEESVVSEEKGVQAGKSELWQVKNEICRAKTTGTTPTHGSTQGGRGGTPAR